VLTGQILLQLIVILLVVQVFGYLCKFIGQPRVMGEILAGLALGPTLLGAILPRVEATVFPSSVLPTLQTLGDIGLVLYMFSLGTHIDTHTMLRQSRKATVVSLSGILLPLALGGMFAFFLYPEFAGSKANMVSFMLLVGTVMAITAFPVLARLLAERHMLATTIGTLALTCAAIDDVIGWCLLALVIAIINATGVASVAVTIGLLVLFVGVMLGVVRPLLLMADRRIKSKPVLKVLTMVLLLLSAYTTNAMGIHPVFGAFMMGIILPRRTAFIEQVQSIDQINNLLFLPLYFVYNGLRTHIGLINSPTLWLICGLVLKAPRRVPGAALRPLVAPSMSRTTRMVSSPSSTAATTASTGPKSSRKPARTSSIQNNQKPEARNQGATPCARSPSQPSPHPHTPTSYPAYGPICSTPASEPGTSHAGSIPI